MFSFTIFKTQYDNETHRVMDFDTWEEFVGMMKKLGEMPGAKDNNTPQFSPAIYKKGTTRANANVQCWGGWAAIDVDCELPEDFEAYIRKIAKPYAFHCYSTGSSSIEKPKMRIVVPLSERPEGDTIKHLWYALNKTFRELNAAQTKDASRMYYVPADYKDTYKFSFTGEGKVVDVQHLIVQHPYQEPNVGGFASKLPEAIQAKLVEYKHNQLNNTDITWCSYQDCPFFPKKLARQYSTIGEGWYHHVYRMMVAIASSAIAKQYPITADQIEKLMKDFDRDHGNWYDNRPLNKEAKRALNYVLSK